MIRSSTDHQSIKPPNLIPDCISPKPKQQKVLHDVHLIHIKKTHKPLQGSPNFEKIQPSKKVWLLSPGRQESVERPLYG